MNLQTTVAVAEAGRPVRVGSARVAAAAGVVVAEVSPVAEEALAVAAAAGAGNMRRELIRVTAIIIFSVLLVAILTSFQFNSIDIQFHDTYVILPSAHAIIFVSIILLAGRYIYRLNLFLINRSKAFAIVLAVIIPVALCYLAAMVYTLASLIHVIANPEGQITLEQNAWLVYIPATILIALLIALEVVAIRKIALKNR